MNRGALPGVVPGPKTVPAEVADYVAQQMGSSSVASLTVKDEGSALATAADTLDFVGAGVTATGTAGTKTITIPGGSTIASQTGNAGKFLTTDGSTTSWGATPGTNLGWFDVTAAPYSADKTGATDCTAAIQSALNDAIAAGGGTIYFPRGIYLMSAAPTSGTSNGRAYSGQILFPMRTLAVGQMAVRFLGETPSPLALWGPQVGDNVPVEVGGSIIRSTATSGNMFDAITAASPLSNFTNLNVIFDSLTFRAPNNPQVGGLNLAGVLSAHIRDCTVGVNASAGTISQPTGSAYGIQMPNLSNAAQVSIHRSQVYGFPTALSHSEHCVFDEFVAYLNVVGIELRAAYHISNYLRVGLYENVTHMKVATAIPVGQQPTIVGRISVEQGISGHWYSNQSVINDPELAVYGSLKWHVIRAAVGQEPNLAAQGGLNLSLSSLRTDSVPSKQVTNISASMTATDSAYTVPTADSGHPAWPVYGVWGISSNKAYHVSGNNTNMGSFLAWKSTVTNPTITATVKTSPTTNRTQSGLACRIVGGQDFLVARIRIDTSVPAGVIELCKVAVGTMTTLATATPTLAANTSYVLAVQMTSTQIIVSLDGVTQITYTLTGAEQTAYNSGRMHGLWTYFGNPQDDGGTRWSNLTIA